MDNRSENSIDQNRLTNYQFTSAELRVLRECNTESFFQRSLPFGSGLAFAVYFAIKNGFLKPSLKYGMTPKVSAGFICGYFLGKFSYQGKCAQKLMQLPNSRVGELLKQRKQGSVMQRFTAEQNLGIGLALAPFNQPIPDIYNDDALVRNPNTALNLDLDMRPSLSELDDIYRPSLDSNNSLNEPEIPVEPLTPGTSYEELRRKNREEYAKKQSALSNSLPVTAIVMKENSLDNDSKENQRIPQTNKYGDTWTE